MTSARRIEGANRSVLAIAVDESATRLTAAFDPAMPRARLWHGRVESPSTPDGLLAGIEHLVGHILADAQTSAEVQRPLIRVALWADLDHARGEVLRMRRLPEWEGVPLADALAERLGADVTIETVTNAIAAGQARVLGRAATTDLYVLLRRGITCALVADGRVVQSAPGAGGRLGHSRVRLDGPRCSCGERGHLEPLASSQAVVRTFIGKASATAESTAALLGASGGRAEAISAAQVVRLANQGDPAATAVVDEATDALAVALGNLALAIGPDALVLSGPLVEAGDLFLDPLRSRLVTAMSPFAPPTVVTGPSDIFVTLLGLAEIARDEVADGHYP